MNKVKIKEKKLLLRLIRNWKQKTKIISYNKNLVRETESQNYQRK